MIACVSANVLLNRWDYLSGVWGVILDEHGWALAASALTAEAGVFAAIRWAISKIGLADLSRKVERIGRGAREDGAVYDSFATGPNEIWSRVDRRCRYGYD